MNEIAINVDSLTVFYGKYCVIRDITFSINKNEFVTIVGPNGGGKTTLLKAILGLVEPTNGKIEVFSKPPKELDFHEIGYVPQIKNLDRTFPAKVIELVATGLTGKWKFVITKEIRNLALEALAKTGIENLAERPLTKLSGGELQRVYLARSIIRKPKLLILDEPATGIDSVAEVDFSKILEEQQKMFNTTILMVTHDWEYAFHHSNKVILLNKRLIAFDSPKKAFTEENLKKTFGHIGHEHTMQFIIDKNA